MSVSRLGLGLAAIGRPAYITAGRSSDLGDGRTVEAMWRRSLELLDQAYAAGVRYFDAARSYGRAEEFLGEWLAAGPADVVVGSKWGYRYVGDWHSDADVHEVKDLSLAKLERQFALDIGQHRKRQIAQLRLVLAPCEVHELRVDADAQHLRVAIRELAVQLAERRDFGRAHEGKVLGPEKHDPPLAGIALAVDRLKCGADVVRNDAGEFEVGETLTDA